MLEMVLKMLPKEYGELVGEIKHQIEMGGKFYIVMDLPYIRIFRQGYEELGRDFKITMPEEVKK